MPMIDMTQRRNLAAEVENGFTRNEYTPEARRCYLCHYAFEIDMRTCIYCDWCIKAKPAHLECIKKVAGFERDTHGIVRDVSEAGYSDQTRAIWIDSHECIRCGQCLRACPVDAISLKKVFLDEETCEPGECGNRFLELQE
jgi:ferredoxin